MDTSKLPEEFGDNGIISKLYDRKQHISYDISKRNEKKIGHIYSMVKSLDNQSQKLKYYNSQLNKTAMASSNCLLYDRTAVDNTNTELQAFQNMRSK